MSDEMNGKRTELFYDTVGPKGIEEASEYAGIQSGQDLELLERRFPEFLPKGMSLMVVEIGAGSGRVLKWILRHLPKLLTIAIEPFTKNFEGLRKNYAKFGKRVLLWKMDVLTLGELQMLVDRVLWMFSGLAEILPKDRNDAFRQIAKILRPSGKLVIDMFVAPAQEQLAKIRANGGFIEVSHGGAKIMLHVPTAEEILGYAAAAGLIFEGVEYYSPKPGALRMMVVFGKA